MVKIYAMYIKPVKIVSSWLLRYGPWSGWNPFRLDWLQKLLFGESNEVNDMNIFWLFHHDMKLTFLANCIKEQAILDHLGGFITLCRKMLLKWVWWRLMIMILIRTAWMGSKINSLKFSHVFKLQITSLIHTLQFIFDLS